MSDAKQPWGQVEAETEVRARRLARGLSEAELAKCAGTSQAAIARLEAGAVEPTFRTLDKVGAALGLTLDVRLLEPSSSGQQGGFGSGGGKDPRARDAAGRRT